jgi:hypothetical protein
MGKFYRDIHEEFISKKSAQDSARNARARAKAFEDSLKEAFLKVASEGGGSCYLQALESITSDKAEVSPDRIEGGHIVNIPADIFVRVLERLQNPLGFNVSFYATGIRRVSWEDAEKPTAPEPEPTNPRGTPRT